MLAGVREVSRRIAIALSGDDAQRTEIFESLFGR